MAEPVLFIPGYPASELRTAEKKIFPSLDLGQALLEGPGDLDTDDGVRTGEPIRAYLSLLIFDLAKQAGSLYRLLDRIGVVHVERFGWDWRRPVWDDAHDWSVQNRLEVAIRDLRLRTGQPVTLLAHSTGGLIVRHLLERRPDRVLPHVRRLVALGVPWAGLIRTIHFLQGDDGFVGVVPPRRTQQILARSWAAFDLVPPDPTHLAQPLVYRRSAGGGRQAVDPLEETGWLNVLPPELRQDALDRAGEASQRLRGRRPTLELGGRPLDVVNVAGWGYPTQVEAEATGVGPEMRLAAIRSDDGDGTVPRRSAAWLEGGDGVAVRTYHLPVGYQTTARVHPHAALWQNPGGHNLLRHLLAGEPLQPFAYAALDRDDSRENGPPIVRVRLVALNPDGTPAANARVRTTDLQGGAQLEEEFDPANEGRHLMRVPRNLMRVIERQDRYRRFGLEISWDETGRRVAVQQKFLFFD